MCCDVYYTTISASASAKCKCKCSSSDRCSCRWYQTTPSNLPSVNFKSLQIVSNLLFRTRTSIPNLPCCYVVVLLVSSDDGRKFLITWIVVNYKYATAEQWESEVHCHCLFHTVHCTASNHWEKGLILKFFS